MSSDGHWYNDVCTPNNKRLISPENNQELSDHLIIMTIVLVSIYTINCKLVL